MATKKAQTQVKQLATKGDVKNAKILAREVVRSHKQKDLLSVSKARLGSINNQLMQQLGEYQIKYYINFIMSLNVNSHGQGYRNITEVYRNNETFKFTDQATSNQSNDA